MNNHTYAGSPGTMWSGIRCTKHAAYCAIHFCSKHRAQGMPAWHCTSGVNEKAALQYSIAVSLLVADELRLVCALSKLQISMWTSGVCIAIWLLAMVVCSCWADKQPLLCKMFITAAATVSHCVHQALNMFRSSPLSCMPMRMSLPPTNSPFMYT